jgi:hypothetical protein
MKRTILVVISCLLLLGLLVMALPGCGGGGGGGGRVVGNGTQVGVFPKAASSPYSNYISRAFLGMNFTAVEYPGTGSMAIPSWMTGNWSTW